MNATEDAGEGRRLSEELERIRERSLSLLDAIAKGASEAAGLGREPSGAYLPEHDDAEELPDDDLGLRERVQKCSDLRTTLTHQCGSAGRTPSSADLEELIRINDAIDRALMESIARARGRARRAHEMFLAMLAHDLRTPLGAVLMASEYLVEKGELTDRDSILASRIRSSGQRMNGLIDELVDFTRCRMGAGIPVNVSQTSVGAIAREVVEEARAGHPDCALHLEVRGPVHGRWDADRLWQALSNLVENAVWHGEGGSVHVRVSGVPDEVVVSVHNPGTEIPEDDRKRMFNPFERCPRTDAGRRCGRGLGLGLYIARQIAVAHGGAIEVSSSSEAGTTFALHLPRER